MRRVIDPSSSGIGGGQEGSRDDASFHGQVCRVEIAKVRTTEHHRLMLVCLPVDRTDFQSEINTLTPHVVPILDQLEGEDDSYLLYL